uniref:Lactate/malate dehydrogenase C-terminal domain-containing protein n=1 Tax=Clastoptera arizonana TaxID=38151 RepID=A0A1B6E3Z1_9HEMI
MCTHYICGINNCMSFAQVIYMCQEISKLMPFFKYEVISLNKKDFEIWYKNFFEENNLKPLIRHKSPVIWRQWLSTGRNKSLELIGGYSEFIEFCKECLHVESLWTSKQTEEFAKKILESASKVPPSALGLFCICILGAGHPATRLLVFELLKNAQHLFSKNLHLYLSDCKCSNNEVMNQIAEDATYLQEESIVEVVSSLENALKNCQLLIIIKEINGQQEDILQKYFDFMIDTADLFVKHSSPSCRVLFACTNYSCFNATVFLREILRVNKNREPNIAAVTSDKALKYMHFLQHATSVPMEDLYGTPVWGFIDVNDNLIVDYLQTNYNYLKKKRILINGSLSSSTKESNKLLEEHNDGDDPNATEEEEEEVTFKDELLSLIVEKVATKEFEHVVLNLTNTLAKFEQKLQYVNDWVKLQEDSITNIHQRNSIMSQVKATMKLLDFWFCNSDDYHSSQDSLKNNFTFAGIPTDGSFGLRPGLVISQPVMYKNKYIIPFNEYTGPCNYPLKKIRHAYKMVDDFGLYYPFGDYASDKLIKYIQHECAKMFFEDYSNKTVLHNKNLKSRVKACLQEQKKTIERNK